MATAAGARSAAEDDPLVLSCSRPRSGDGSRSCAIPPAGLACTRVVSGEAIRSLRADGVGGYVVVSVPLPVRLGVAGTGKEPTLLSAEAPSFDTMVALW